MNLIMRLSMIAIVGLTLAACGGNSTPTPATSEVGGKMVVTDASGNIAETASYGLYRVDNSGNVVECVKETDVIDTKDYFYFNVTTWVNSI